MNKDLDLKGAQMPGAGDEPERKPEGGPRLIDRVRDGALSMQIGTIEEGGIVAMISLGDRLINVKDKAIYAFRLADQIDPGRKNIDVQNVQQRLATVGADDVIVQRTLLTADKFLRPSFLRSDLDKVHILSLYLDLLLTLLSARDIAHALERDQIAAVEAKGVDQGRVVALPSIGNPLERAKSFVQKAEHAAQALYQISVAFLGEDGLRGKGKLFDGVLAALAEKLGKDDPRMPYIDGFVQFCKLLRNARHCVEHMSNVQRVNAHDYELTDQNIVIEPTISFVHEDIPAAKEPMLLVFKGIVEELSLHAECLIALFCGIECVGRMGAFNVAVDYIEDEKMRRPNGVQYGYFIQMGDKWVPLG